MTTWREPLLILALASAAGISAADEEAFSPAKKNHWAWKRPVRPEPPAVRNTSWVKNPIDPFILAKLEAAGLEPAPPASPAQLLRRVTFDLIGLPPTPAEIDAFVNDSSSKAWETVIDRLLASPHYGERWGRHWLDLARFAESNGFEHDEVRPDAWRYRDYVIASFNADKPYDRFIREQIASDELYPDDPAALIATGFNVLGPDMTDASSQAQRRQDRLDDMTDTVGLVFLGLTVGCARCHDHKFEPIPQSDFFRLQAFFAPADFRSDLPVADKVQRALHDKQTREYQALIAPTASALKALEEPYRKTLHEKRLSKLAEAARLAHHTPEPQRTPAQKELVASTNRFLVVSVKEIVSSMTAEERAAHQRLQEELKKLEKAAPPPLPAAMGLQKSDRPAKTFVLKRGELNHPGDEVRAGWPVILSPGFRTEPASASSSAPRTVLADWIARPDNPLTARVLVNRLWQHHFGRGIVATPSDFGLRGARPTHPELLDWLASQFVARGWSIKHMHKLMLLSATYQQRAAASARTMQTDPDNQLFSRMNRIRLEGEIIRDSLLAVSGRLNPKMGGPGVFPPIPLETALGTKEWKASLDPADHVRRSVYIFSRRNVCFPFLEAFDPPDSNQSCPKRERSTAAPQALALLNSADVMDAADALTRRLQNQAASTDERITLAYRLTLGRRASEAELRLSRQFLEHSPLRELCRALFNVNEFVYLD